MSEINGNGPAPMSPEQMADLNALQSGAMVGEVGPGAEPAPEVPAVDLATEISSLVLAFVAIAKPMLPSLGTIYTEEATGSAAEVVAALCHKHGWAEDGLMGDYGEEIAAAIVLLPLGFATVQGVKKDLGDLKRKNDYIEMRKDADLRQHMNIAHNLDGKTEPAPAGSVQGWQPPGETGEN